jgi:hypothetical protein
MSWRSRAGNPEYFGAPEPAYGSAGDYGRSRNEAGYGAYGHHRDWGHYYADEGDPSWRGGAGSAGQYGSQSAAGQSAAGEHRGRGPRGYRRSDDRIREDVCERLTDDDRLDASEIEVTVKDCEVQLSGTVGSREDKRRAENLVDQVSGVQDVHNGLRVQERAGATQAGGEAAAASETRSRH